MSEAVEEPVAVRKKPGKGHTAMRHARAIVNHRWPNAPPPITAGKRIIYTPKGPRSIGEDIWGVFDLLVVGFADRGAAIQVTTEQAKGQTVTARKRKIEKWLEETGLEWGSARFAPSIEIWSWVNGSHMKRWGLLPEDDKWVPMAELRSPLLASFNKPRLPGL